MAKRAGEPEVPRAVGPQDRGKGSQEAALSWVSPSLSPEYKKSFENDAQSSDNINFLKVQWSSRQLPTVRLLAGPGPVGEGTGRGVVERVWFVHARVCVCVCVVGLGMSKGEGPSCRFIHPFINTFRALAKCQVLRWPLRM